MARVVSTLVQVHVVQPAEPAGWKHLVLRRSRSDELYPELWQCVTGTIRPNETAIAAAQRELREETGLIGEEWWVVPVMSSFYNWQQDSIELVSTFGTVVAPGAAVHLTEHEAYRWEELTTASTMLVVPSQREGAACFEQLLNSRKQFPQITLLYRLS